MGNIKFTKGELKRQKDRLRQFERYLPILLLKKQQLQLEIQKVHQKLDLKVQDIEAVENEISEWSGLLEEEHCFNPEWVKPKKVYTKALNIAGIDIPVFDKIEFEDIVYDLFFTPLWVDKAIDKIKGLVTLLEEEKILKDAAIILSKELRITTQRVNLFEKVKIPECRENARVIRIYLGDQEVNAVGRSKIAKSKIKRAVLEEVFV